MRITDNPIPVFKRTQTLAAGLALVGLGGLLFALFTDIKAFYASFVFAWSFWGGLSIGAMTLTFLHHTIRAQWSLSILRFVEAANKTILPMGILFAIPMFYGVLTGQIYQWSVPSVVAESELLQRKTWMLNVPGYIIFTVIVFVYWWWLGRHFNESSRRQDDTMDERLAERRSIFAPPAGVVHVILLTGAVTYWIMSLDAAWFSTIYGVWFMIQEMRCMIALGTMILLGLRFTRPVAEIMTPNVCRDLGWMLVGLSMFWAYISLSQFLIIWSANLPEEITYYINRFTGGLVYVGAIIIIGQFLIPFLLLLSYNTKRVPERLWPVAIWIFVFSIVDIWWNVTPFFRVGLTVADIPAYLLDLGALAGIGGVWLYLFVGNLIAFAKDGVLIPRHDTRLVEAKLELEAHHA